MKFPDAGGSSGPGSGSKLFVKLGDGDKITGLFRGDPKVFRTHWVDNKSHKCTGRETCVHCKNGDKSKLRFRLNFITKENGVLVAKIFEGSGNGYYDLKELHENGYDLEQTIINITRTGLKQDTRYSFIPAPKNGGVSEKGIEQMHAVPLNDLSDDARGPGHESAPTSDDEVPF